MATEGLLFNCLGGYDVVNTEVNVLCYAVSHGTDVISMGFTEYTYEHNAQQ